MNEKPRELLPQQMPYYAYPGIEDEVSLVDTWIAVSAYKKLFWGVFSTLLLIGIILAIFVFSEKYTLASAIQIGSVHNNGVSTAIETPESLKSKLKDVFIPRITSNWMRDNPEFGVFKTTILNVKESDVILIQHKVKQSQIKSFISIQNLITLAIIDHHKEKTSRHQSYLMESLEVEKVKLKELEDKGNRPVETSDEKTAEYEKSDQLVILEIIKTREARIASQEQVIRKIQDKISFYDITRVISEPVVSFDNDGPGRKTLVLLVFFLAGFGAFCFILIAMFRDKVKERLLETE